MTDHQECPFFCWVYVLTHPGFRSRQSASQAFALFRSVTLGRRRPGKQLKLKANWKTPHKYTHKNIAL